MKTFDFKKESEIYGLNCTQCSEGQHCCAPKSFLSGFYLGYLKGLEDSVEICKNLVIKHKKDKVYYPHIDLKLECAKAIQSKIRKVKKENKL